MTTGRGRHVLAVRDVRHVLAVRDVQWRPPQLGNDQTPSQHEDRQGRDAPLQEIRQEQLRKEQTEACEFSSAGKIGEHNLDGQGQTLL